MKSFLKNKVSVKQRSLLCSVQSTLMQNLFNKSLQLGDLIWSEILKGRGFPGGTSAKEPACPCRRCKDAGSIPGSGRSLGGGHGNPLQYSCLENPRLPRRIPGSQGAWWATILGVTRSQAWLKWLSKGSEPAAGKCGWYLMQEVLRAHCLSTGGTAPPLPWSALGSPCRSWISSWPCTSVCEGLVQEEW